MKPFAKEHGLSSPHVVGETQVVARAYDAVGTPEFFGFNASLEPGDPLLRPTAPLRSSPMAFFSSWYHQPAIDDDHRSGHVAGKV